MRDEAWYRQLKKSPLTPPSWIFPIVWPILYILIIISGVIYVKNGGSLTSTGFGYYMISWILNLSWSPIYFTYKMTGISFIVILLMVVFIYLTINAFYTTSKLASYLLIPYLLWVSFASYLNGYIYFMN